MKPEPQISQFMAKHQSPAEQPKSTPKNQTPETHLKVQASQNIYVKTEQTSTLKTHGINIG